MIHRHKYSTQHSQHRYITHNTYNTHTTHNFFLAPHYFLISSISSMNLFFSLSFSQTQLATIPPFHMSLKKPDLGVFHDDQIKFEKDFSIFWALDFP